MGIIISHLSIPEIVVHRKCYISHCFFLTVPRVVPVFFKCVISLTSFLFKSKFTSFPICDSAHLYSAHQVIIVTVIIIILLLLIININIYIYILHVLFCYYFSFSLFSNAKISLILLLQLSS